MGSVAYAGEKVFERFFIYKGGGNKFGNKRRERPSKRRFQLK